MTTSHWHATAPTHQLNLPDPLPRTADAIVLGGGILGVSAAYWLARSGVRALLLDQLSLAAGATGRNGGFVTVGAALSYTRARQTLGCDTARAIWQMTYDSRSLLKAVIEGEGITCDYREPGTIHIVRSAREMVHMRNEIALLNADGFRHEWLDRAGLQGCVFTALGDDIAGASLLIGGGLLHSASLVAGIAHAARRWGVRLCQAEVMHLTMNRDAMVIHTHLGSIETPALIVAANAWTRELVPGMRAIITPVRGQVVSFEPIERVFVHGFGVEVTDTGEYWQQTPDGVIVLGGCRAAHATRDEDMLADDVTHDVQAALDGVLPGLFPALAGRLNARRRWSGPMAFTPDRLPVMDRVPDLPNAWFVGGFCGHGMPFGLVFGQALAGATVSGSLPDMFTPFALGRFQSRNTTDAIKR